MASDANRRFGAPFPQQNEQFGPLAQLQGTWVGTGFNLISKPGFSVKEPFVLQINATKEVLTFTPISAPIPDRGSEQPDIDIFALNYQQVVSDATTNSLLHVEQGMWLNVPASTDPSQPATVVRLAVVPHGDSVLAQGIGLTGIPGPPDIQPVSPIPFEIGPTGPISLTGTYFPPDPFAFPAVNPFPIPAAFDLDNPNAALTTAIEGQNITSMVVLEVSTTTSEATEQLLGGGGILNIPFVDVNADALSLDAIFWIETVGPTSPGGQPFLQLQYTQTVILAFPAFTGPTAPANPNNPVIHWPHISVATLVKN